MKWKQEYRFRHRTSLKSVSVATVDRCTEENGERNWLATTKTLGEWRCTKHKSLYAAKRAAEHRMMMREVDDPQDPWEWAVAA